MRGAERFLAQHEDLGEERLRVVARRTAPTELDQEERERRVVLRPKLLREDTPALEQTLSFGRVLLEEDFGLLREQREHARIVWTVCVRHELFCLPEQSNGFRRPPGLEVR